jgi:uncharacterized membrane protein
MDTICLFLTSGATLALPWLSAAPFLFGARVGARFRRSGPGREALRTYYVSNAAGLLAAAGLAPAFGLNHPWTWVLAALLPYAGAGLGFYRANHILRQYAEPAEAPAVREADLSASEDRLPRWTLWAVPPFLLPLAGAAYVHAHWTELPARIAIHYGLDGQPNGWVTRTPLHVYGLFIFAAGLMLWILLLGIATYFGARRSPSRQTTLGIAISVMCLLGTVFTGVGILPVRHFPVWILAAIPPPYVAGLLFWVLRTGAAPEVPSESTPDQCWSMGDIYNNPNDPALFVPKHVGAGYTINIGNPMAKWLISGFVGGLALLIAFMFWVVS